MIMDENFIISGEMIELMEKEREAAAESKLFETLTNTAKSKPQINYPSASNIGRMGMAERLDLMPFAFELMILDAAKHTEDETIVSLFEELILAVSLRGYESIQSIAAINERVDNEVKRRQEKINAARETLLKKFPNGKPAPYDKIDPQWNNICDRAAQSYNNAAYKIDNMSFEDKVFFVILCLSSRYFEIFSSGSVTCDFEQMKKFKGSHINDITKKYTMLIKAVKDGNVDNIREVNRLTGNKLHLFYQLLDIKLS
ncbi:hypothetical protein FDI40_gp307 [Agrobacterium phage Atu_ph07]|uniref:Uncharacterized protein n=1 Tax=Agrobacterium phage Atu_ph07 TaxID=2024264 RepID=A0A2L0UZW3_9CAUD|nr:hypothetical protein FDI40_gp307 [Agrobacterium phage Atu_ph07]AUZ95073.1 hypothetical protein [Agrobacterium phage Atu_ph07]